MQNFIKTIINAVQSWTKKEIKDSTADWNQSDSSADNYVKNRTHWEEIKETILVDNLTFDEYTSNNAPQCNFVPNQTYIVIWNGEKYENLVCYYDGEFNVISGDNHPFYIDDDGGNNLYIEPRDGSTNWTVSIFTTETVVHKLDSKYVNIPTNLATTDDVQNVSDLASEALQIAENVITQIEDEKTGRTEADASKMDKNNPVGAGSFSINGAANGDYSCAVGYGTIAGGRSRCVSGEYNAYQAVYKDYYAEYQSGKVIFSNTGNFYCSAEYDFNPETGMFTLIKPTLIAASEITSNSVLDKLLNVYFVGGGSQLSPNSVTGTHLYGPIKDYLVHQGGTPVKVSTTVGKHNNYNNKLEKYQHHYGLSDVSEKGKYVHIVGNGTSDTARSNAHTLDWNGLGWFAGGLKVGGTGQDDEAAVEVALKSDIPSVIVQSVNGVTPDANGNVVIEVSGGETVTDEHINELIDAKLGIVSALVDEINGEVI